MTFVSVALRPPRGTAKAWPSCPSATGASSPRQIGLWKKLRAILAQQDLPGLLLTAKVARWRRGRSMNVLASLSYTSIHDSKQQFQQTWPWHFECIVLGGPSEWERRELEIDATRTCTRAGLTCLHVCRLQPEFSRSGFKALLKTSSIALEFCFTQHSVAGYLHVGAGHEPETKLATN